jgi:hypothetical protein
MWRFGRIPGIPRMDARRAQAVQPAQAALRNLKLPDLSFVRGVPYPTFRPVAPHAGAAHRS